MPSVSFLARPPSRSAIRAMCWRSRKKSDKALRALPDYMESPARPPAWAPRFSVSSWRRTRSAISSGGFS